MNIDLNSSKPLNKFKIVESRIKGLEYDISHFKNFFYILNKDGANNFKLMRTLLKITIKENWKNFIPHRKDILN